MFQKMNLVDSNQDACYYDFVSRRIHGGEKWEITLYVCLR